MKISGKGNETRYDSPAEQIDRARRSAPGAGHPLNGLKVIWCWKCGQQKPRIGSKKRGELYKCSPCVKGSHADN